MEFLGLDPVGVRALASELIRVEARTAHLSMSVVAAESLSGVSSGVAGRLGRVGADLLGVASALSIAARRIEEFRLPLHEVSIAAGHNTYLPGRAIDQAAAAGITVFELDVHRGPPTRWRGDVLPPHAAVGAAVVEHLVLDDGDAEAWYVYHTSFDPSSSYPSLTDGLAAVARAADMGSGPVTLFVDVKDRFAGTHTPAAFDDLLRHRLGDRLFTPADLLATAPGASTLQAAVQRIGWPELTQLDGRVIVALTDEVDGYDQLAGVAFVAGRAAEFDPQGSTVIWNTRAGSITATEIETIRDHANLIRVWGGGTDELDATFGARDVGGH